MMYSVNVFTLYISNYQTIEIDWGSFSIVRTYISTRNLSFSFNALKKLVATLSLFKGLSNQSLHIFIFFIHFRNALYLFLIHSALEVTVLFFLWICLKTRHNVLKHKMITFPTCWLFIFSSSTRQFLSFSFGCTCEAVLLYVRFTNFFLFLFPLHKLMHAYYIIY